MQQHDPAQPEPMEQGHDNAPGRTARTLDFGGYQVTGRTVTIAADPALIHDHFRDPARLNTILGSDLRVEPAAGDHLVWVLATPSRDIRVETAPVHDRPGEMRAWRSVEGAELDVEIKVQLREAPAGRGTEVEAHVAYRPKWGLAGHLAARLRGIDPKAQGRQALKRLKMLLETGEIATARNRRPG